MNNERGFTLAEMLVVCAIVGLVMASLLALVMTGQKAYWYGTTQVDAQQTVRVALERMVREIREAGYDPVPPNTTPATCASPSPCYQFDAIASQSATGLTLRYNWDASVGTTPSATAVNDPILCPTGAGCRGEQVIYNFSGGNLTRREVGMDATPLVVASGLTDLTFTYTKEDGTAATAATDIRTVVVSVTAQTANNGAIVTMTDRIRLRNR